MKTLDKTVSKLKNLLEILQEKFIGVSIRLHEAKDFIRRSKIFKALQDQRGDVPGWVLVVLMTTGLVTAIWAIAAPRLSAILKNSLDSMNGIR